MDLLLKDKQSIEELDKLKTKRLLMFYKKERLRFYRFIGAQTCKCCGEKYLKIYPDDEYYKNAENLEKEWGDYLKKIKELLNKREHVN